MFFLFVKKIRHKKQHIKLIQKKKKDHNEKFQQKIRFDTREKIKEYLQKVVQH